MEGTYLQDHSVLIAKNPNSIALSSIFSRNANTSEKTRNTCIQFYQVGCVIPVQCSVGKIGRRQGEGSAKQEQCKEKGTELTCWCSGSKFPLSSGMAVTFRLQVCVAGKFKTAPICLFSCVFWRSNNLGTRKLLWGAVSDNVKHCLMDYSTQEALHLKSHVQEKLASSGALRGHSQPTATAVTKDRRKLSSFLSCSCPASRAMKSLNKLENPQKKLKLLSQLVPPSHFPDVCVGIWKGQTSVWTIPNFQAAGSHFTGALPRALWKLFMRAAA